MKALKIWLSCSGLVLAACEADHDVVGEVGAGAPGTGVGGSMNTGAKSGVESTRDGDTRGGTSAASRTGGNASVGGNQATGSATAWTGGNTDTAAGGTNLGGATINRGGANTTSAGSNGSSIASGGQTHQQTLTGGQTYGGSATQSSTSAGAAGGDNTGRCGGPSGTKCPTGQFCDLASACGSIPNATGTCVPTGPDLGCTAQVDPVCGCDGVTYSNECERMIAGALKFADGACGSTAAYPTAYLAWQAPGGVAGTGPAVIVSGAGWADTWTNVSSFEPEMPPSSATGTFTLAKTQTDALFARLAGMDWASLPHPTTTWVECYPELYLRLCSDCAARTLNYNIPSQLLPEMEPVWAWFDTLLGAARENPRQYCNF